jgi:hypothetical protein
MSVANVRAEIRASQTVIAKTAACTLTAAELEDLGVIRGTATSGFTVTLPDPATIAANTEAKVVCGGTGSILVYYSSGFGGKGASYDTVTVSEGTYCTLFVDNSKWFAQYATVPA